VYLQGLCQKKDFCCLIYLIIEKLVLARVAGSALGHEKIRLYGGQVSIALQVKMMSTFGVLEYWSVEVTKNSKLQ